MTLKKIVLLFLMINFSQVWADSRCGLPEAMWSDLSPEARAACERAKAEAEGNAAETAAVPAETAPGTAAVADETAPGTELPPRREEVTPTSTDEVEAERAAAAAREAAIATDTPTRTAGVVVPDEDASVELGGTELTPADEARRAAAEEAERLRIQQAEEAQAAAERIAQQRRDRDARGAACVRDKENLVNHQRQIFNLESNQGKSLLELLKKQDDLKARIATYQTLLDIWKEYQGFLSSNENLVNGAMQSPASAQEALGRLDELESFIGNNQQAVERYHVAAEVLNALPDRQELRGLATEQDKFNYIVNALESECNRQGPNAESLYVCGIDHRRDLSLEPVINRNPRTRAEIINKFVNTAVEIDGADYVFNLNFSTLFVDDPDHVNQTGQPEFASTMQTIIRQSKDYCRNQILLEDSEDVNCLRAPLNEVLGGDLGRAQENVIRRLQALNGGSIENIGDLTQSYLQMAARTNSFHEEMAGGTINTLGTMAENISTLQQQFDSAEAALTNPSTLRVLRTQFKNLSKEKLLNLGRSLNHNEFQRNQELFKNYLGDNPNLLNAPGSLNFEKEAGQSKAQFANKLVEEILCGNSEERCPISGGIFSQNGDDLVLDQESILDIFDAMMESAGGPDALKNILGEEQEQGLKDELSLIQAQIAAIKNGPEYRSLNAFKDFIWEQAKESCMSGPENEGDEVLVHQGSNCTLPGEIQSGLNDFLQIGGDFLAYQNREDARDSLRELASACERMHDQDNPRYSREYVTTGICPAVFEESRRVAQDNIRRAENVRRGPTTHDPNIIYEYDSSGRVVDRHVPSSNLAIFLPQAAYAVNEQLPFYFVQRPAMNMAIDSWRRAGIQQKTAQAYWDAQRQSFLNSTVCGPFGCYYNSTMLETATPTFGNFGFGFGSTTTTPTTFTTVPTTSSGFGF